MGRRVFLLLMAMAMVAALGPAIVLADPTDNANYGENAGNWVLDNVKTPWKAAVAAGALAFLFPGARKLGIIISYIAAVIITGMFVFDGGSIVNMVTAIGHKIAGTS
jgi:hypothetical protein